MATDNFDYGNPLKGINRRAGLERELQSKGYNASYIKPNSTSYAQEIQRQNIESPAVKPVGFAGINDSSYDAQITSESQLDNLSDTRGELQPWYAQIGAGLAKAGVLASTTLADGIIGTIVGAGNAATTETFSGFWDNPFSNAMQDVNKWSEKALPNYYTDAELKEPWYENIFTSNFIGDKLIKNLGFAVGAYYAGKPVAMATSKVLGFDKARKAFKGAITTSGEALDTNAAIKAYKAGDAYLDGVQLTEDLVKNASKMNMAAPVLKIVGSVAGALGESRIEAISNSKDWADLHMQQLDEARSKVEQSEIENLINENPNYSTMKLDENGNFTESLTLEGQAIVDERVKSKFDYEGGVKKIAEDRLKMGNVDFLLNLPLLTLSDAWQFGKLYAGGFNKARKVNNITKKVAENGGISYEALKPSKLRIAGKVLSKGIAEGPVEEMGQAVAAKASGYKYASELNNFYGAKIDPDAEKETIDWMKSIGKAISETYGTAAGWEEGFIGGLIGMVGIPGFRGLKNSEGKIQSPIYLQGGMRDDIREITEDNERTSAIVDQMNSRVQSPEFLNYYQSAIRHNKYQRDMDEATANNDNFEFKNAEHNQLINDVIMFDKAGRIQDLYDVIDEVGRSASDNFTDEEVISKIRKESTDMKLEVDKYRKISSDLQAKIGDVFSEESLEEMTYMFSNIDNIETRFKNLHTSIKDRLAEMAIAVPNEEFVVEGQDGKLKIGDLLSMNPIQLLQSLSKSTDAQTFINALDKVLPKTQERADILNDAKDLGRMAEKRIEFVDNYNGYIHNPKSLQNKIDKEAETVSNDKITEEKNKLKESLLQVDNLSDFRKVLGQETSPAIKNEILTELETEGNTLVKDYKEVQQYSSAVTKAVDLLNVNPQVKADALSILQDQFNNSSNLAEISNTNSAHIDNAGALYDSELTEDENLKKFTEAQLALVEAMTKANKDEKFKSKFSGISTPPSTKSTSVKETSIPSTKPIPPVGNITNGMSLEDIKAGNQIAETPISYDNKQTGTRLYYKPTIPELHIQASLDGDFRPYDVVVKEKEGADYSTFYNYLRDNGAFDYVNEGNIKPGDEIGFMIDPALEDQMSAYPWYKGPSIFMIDKRNNQIVGSLDSKKSIVGKYEGLQQLIDKVKDEFTKLGTKDKFIASPTTKVSQVMVGRIPYSQESKNLEDVSNVDPKTAVFGIVKNGTLDTNNKLKDNQVVKPVDMSNKEGRMYLLIPNAQGKYSPASVRVKHFNKEEFNPEDTKISSTKVFNNIKDGITAIASVTNETELKAAVGQLARDLYIGDLHIDFVSSDFGTSVRFTKVYRDAQGKEVLTGELTKDGKPIRKENVKLVTLQESVSDVLFTVYGDNDVRTGGETEVKSIDTIVDEITNVLLDFNLPIQVNIGTLNTTGYNQLLIGSGVLTSNLKDARVLSSWFTTDYFDANGKLQSALNPASYTPAQRREMQTPVGGTEGVAKGIPISLPTLEDGKVVRVDLQTNTIYDENGKVYATSNDSLYFDLAYIQSNFGSSMNSATMLNGKCVLPTGKVLDRTAGEYLNESDAKKVIRSLYDRIDKVYDSNDIVNQIVSNQSNVDKTKTDDTSYYVLEEDGDYHPYDRVHTRLGSNWVQSPKQTEALKIVQIKLSELANNVSKYNEYLNYLSKHYHIDLSNYLGRVGYNSRSTVLNLVRDVMNSTNSQRALEAGNAVDTVIRNFFISKEVPSKPSNMTESAYIDLITSLNEIKSNIELKGETFITNNIVLYHKYSDGTRIAGEVDILAVDTEGNFKIYDVKTSKYSFHDFVDKRGMTVNYFNNKSNTQVMSTKDYYSQQLSAYKNLFESQYNTSITQLAVLPFVLNYEGNSISSVTKEKGILISYNPQVNVPLAKGVSNPSSQTSSSIPIFNSTIESMNPVAELTDTEMEGSKVGYYVTDDQIKTNYLLSIGKIADKEVYITRIPNYSKGFGKDAPHVASYDYFAVFENGNSVKVSKNALVTTPLNEVINVIKNALNGNPKRVVDMSNASTLISETKEPVVTKPVEVVAATVAKPISEVAPSQESQQVLNRLEVTGKRRRPGKLRQVDTTRPIWDSKKELDWLKKVLPQLSENDLVKVQEGLIKVAESGALAWGQFDNGVITLSNVAAEGTVYHEAFHAVFNLMMNDKTREAIYAEARQKFGNLDLANLEELLAEDFREYVMTKSNEGLSTKIANFFKSLLAKVTNWNYIRPSLNSYYKAINEGKYSGSNYTVSSLAKVSTNNSTDFNSIDANTKANLISRGWTEVKFNSVSQEERDQALICAGL